MLFNDVRLIMIIFMFNYEGKSYKLSINNISDLPKKWLHIPPTTTVKLLCYSHLANDMIKFYNNNNVGTLVVKLEFLLNILSG